jgi:hypothetical protein
MLRACYVPDFQQQKCQFWAGKSGVAGEITPLKRQKEFKLSFLMVSIKVAFTGEPITKYGIEASLGRIIVTLATARCSNSRDIVETTVRNASSNCPNRNIVRLEMKPFNGKNESITRIFGDFETLRIAFALVVWTYAQNSIGWRAVMTITVK